MIPYFAMGIVYFPFRIILNRIARNEYRITDFWKILIGENPDGALWFLYVLFFFSIIACWLVTKKSLSFTIVVTSILSIITLFVALPTPIDNLFFAPFYFIGIYIRMHYEKLKDMLNKIWIKLLAILSFVFSNCIMFTSNVNYFIAAAKIMAAVSGCFLIWWISLAIVQNNRSTSIINWVKNQFNVFGDYSMDIYIFAEPIKVVIRTLLKRCQLIVMVTLTFIISTALAMLVSKYVVRRIKIFKKLFLGC